jgi:HlyD family secretion protein
MTRRNVLALLLAVAASLSEGCQVSRTEAKTRAEGKGSNEDALLLASPGRIETREDPLDIGVAASGVLLSLAVRQSDHVHAGQVLARLDCHDLDAEVSQYESELEVSVRTRARLVAGGRPEDRAAAAFRAKSAEATLSERRAWFERMKDLAAKEAVSKSDLDRAEREWRVAEADYQTAIEQRRAADAEPLREDLAKADAEIQAYKDRVGAAKARLDKCTVESPIDGTVLRTYATAGEFLSVASPKAILTLANLTRLRVRAEVDEQDVGKVKLARSVTVINDGWPGKTFPARISYQAPVMGRRHTRTGDPAERSDRDILEVMVDLDSAAKELPLGLRVTAQFWR